MSRNLSLTEEQLKIAITGGSGFIGSNFVKRLLKDNHEVTVFDSKTKDTANRLVSVIDQIEYNVTDLENLEYLKQELKNFDVVAHFYASANTAIGIAQTDIDLKKSIIATYNILEAMRTNKIKKIIFTSSPAIYGNPAKIPTTEDTGMLFPISLYGAAKLSSEGLISAFCHLFEMKAWIFRLGNVVGIDMTRGVIKDFIKKLKQNPNELEILGNGTQQKDIILLDDCIDGILFAFTNSNDIINIFNLSSGTTISINEIAKIVQQEMNLKNVKTTHKGGNTGWQGDVPIVHYDITKIRKLGWKPKYDSEMAVRLTVKGSLKLQ